MRRTASKISMLPAVIVAAAGLLMTATPAASASVPRDARTAAAQPYAVAPYVFMGASQEGMLDTAAKTGLKAFTAGFVTAHGCTPVWFSDGLPVASDAAVKAEITTAEADGAEPIVSFGAAGTEMAQSCTNVSELTAAYQSVITALHATHIDFYLSPAEMGNATVSKRRFAALSALETQNPGLSVSVSFYILPTGPTLPEQAFFRLAASVHANISLVNIWAADYSTTSANMGADAVKAAKATKKFLSGVFGSWTYAMLGVTPEIGHNDLPAEVFTEADARTLVSFATAHHLGRLAFYSVNRDQPCSSTASGFGECSGIKQKPLAFTTIFDSYTG